MADISDYAFAGFQAGLNTVTGATNANLGLKKSKEYFNYTQQKNQDMQKWLMQNQASYMKQGLKNAGYSVAGTDGDFSTPSASTGDSQNFDPNIQVPDISSMLVGLNQSKLIEEQARAAGAEADMKETENQYYEYRLRNLMKGESYDTENKGYQAEINKATVSDQVQKVQAEALNLWKDGKIKDADYSQIVQLTHKLEEETKGFHIDNEYKAQLNRAQIDMYSADAFKAIQEGNYEAMKVALANMGVYLEGNWIGTAAALASNATRGFFHGSVDSVGNLVSGVASGIVDNIKGYLHEFGDKLSPEARENFYGVLRSIKEVGNKLLPGAKKPEP